MKSLFPGMRRSATLGVGVLAIAATVSAQPQTVIKRGAVTITAPGQNRHRYTRVPLDLSAYKSGHLVIQIKVGKGRSAASFDLYDQKTKIVLEGRPAGSLTGAYDIPPGGTATLNYSFSKPQKLIFAAEGNWFSPKGATNTITYSCTLKNARKK